MANDLQLSVGADTRGAEKSLRAFSGFAGGILQNISGRVGAGLTAALAGYATFAAGQKSIQLFEQQERAAVSLEKVLQSMGRSGAVSLERLSAHATQLQRTGIFGDEEILRGTKMLATFSKISDEALPRTMRVMADFAATFETDITSAALTLGKAAEGNIGALSRMGISLSETTKKSGEFKDILNDIEAQVGGVNQALRESAIGPLNALIGNLGDVAEEAGGAILDYLNPALKALNEYLEERSDKNALRDKIDQIREGADAAKQPLSDLEKQIAAINEQISNLSRGADIRAISFGASGPSDEETALRELLARLQAGSERAGAIAFADTEYQLGTELATADADAAASAAAEAAAKSAVAASARAAADFANALRIKGEVEARIVAENFHLNLEGRQSFAPPGLNVPSGGISRPGDIPGYDFPDVRRRRQFRERFGISPTANDRDALQRILESGGFGGDGDGGDALDGAVLPALPGDWGQEEIRKFAEVARSRFRNATDVLQSGLEDAFAIATRTGKLSFRDVAWDFATELQRGIYQATLGGYVSRFSAGLTNSLTDASDWLLSGLGPAPSPRADAAPGRRGSGDVIIVNRGAPVEVAGVSEDEAGRRVVEIAARNINRGGPLARAERARRF